MFAQRYDRDAYYALRDICDYNFVVSDNDCPYYQLLR